MKRSFASRSSGAASKRPKDDADLLQALSTFFPSMQSFRPGQERVISALMRGQSAAAIFPTGGGKSICYQLPGLLLGEEGLTLVVSPLLALMKDQVDAMQACGHPVDMYNSSLDREERIEVRKRVQAGITKILYVAPEQLNNENSVGMIRSQPISLLAIDEAHCISEWGHAFRPDYLRLTKFVETIAARRVVALTATATPQVAADICSAFQISDDNCVRTPFFRSNLALNAVATTKKARDGQLIAALRNMKEPGAVIVYATLQHTTVAVAETLRDAGIDAKAYHAGLSREARVETQEWFMETHQTSSSSASALRVVVATIAFGMGVDKSDIRAVFHYNMPKSLEGYAQEVGRAGRDGVESFCSVLACADDIPTLEAFAYCGSPSQRGVSNVLREVFEGPKGKAFPRGTVRELSLSAIARAHDMPEIAVRMLLAFVDIYHGYLKQGTPKYALYKVQAADGGPARAVPGILGTATPPAAAAVLRAHCKVKQKWAHIDVSEAASQSGGGGSVTRDQLVSALGSLEQSKQLVVAASSVQYVYTIEAQPPSFDELATCEYQRFKQREAQELNRLQQVRALISAETCQAGMLTAHFEGRDFGSEAAQPGFRCGKCGFCTTGQQVMLPDRGVGARIDASKWQQLAADATIPKDDPLLLARFALGFTSPRIQAMRLKNHELYGAFVGMNYADVLARIIEIYPGLASES